MKGKKLKKHLKKIEKKMFKRLKKQIAALETKITSIAYYKGGNLQPPDLKSWAVAKGFPRRPEGYGCLEDEFIEE